MSDPERQPLLGPTPTGQRSRPWSVGCLIVVTYLQALSSNGITRFSGWGSDLFHINMNQLSAVYFGIGVMLYILPLFIGIYADVIVGKYTALFFGLGLKFTGSLLSFFVVLRLEDWPEIDAINLKVVMALLSASTALLIVGVIMVIPTLGTFGCQQINQATESQAFFIRWALGTVLAGIFTEYFLCLYDVYIPQLNSNYPWLRQHPQTVQHVLRLTLDGLSIAIFLFGKPSYNKPSPAEGRISFKNLMHIVRNHITCLSSRRHYDTIDTSLRMRSTEDDSMYSYTLGKLRIRKSVIAIPLFSAIAASIGMLFWLDQMTIKNVLFYHHRQESILNLVRSVRFAAGLPILPIMELIIRKCGYHTWQNKIINQLKTLGFGIFLSSLSFLTAGVVASILPNHDYLAVSVMYILPHYILIGLALFMVYNSGILFCFTECPSGLSTFAFVLGLNLCIFFVPLEALVALTVADFKNMVILTDVVCYICAAVLLAVLVVIYIPVSIWYVKASRAIEIALEEEEDSGTHTQERSMPGETVGLSH